MSVHGSFQKISYILSRLDAESRNKLDKRLQEISYSILHQSAHQQRDYQQAPANQSSAPGDDINPQSLYLPVSLIIMSVG